MEKIYLLVQCEAISKDLSAGLGILQDSDVFLGDFWMPTGEIVKNSEK